MLLLESCWFCLLAQSWSNVRINITVLKCLKINPALCFHRIMLPHFAFSLFRCSTTICSVRSSSQSASQLCFTLISMYLYVKSPSGEYLRSFTLCWFISHFLSQLPSLAVVEKYTCACTPVSIRAFDQTGDGWIWYPSPHLFWNLEVEAVNRCENNVVTEAKP